MPARACIILHGPTMCGLEPQHIVTCAKLRHNARLSQDPECTHRAGLDLAPIALMSSRVSLRLVAPPSPPPSLRPTHTRRHGGGPRAGRLLDDEPARAMVPLRPRRPPRPLPSPLHTAHAHRVCAHCVRWASGEWAATVRAERGLAPVCCMVDSILVKVVAGS